MFGIWDTLTSFPLPFSLIIKQKKPASIPIKCAYRAMCTTSSHIWCHSHKNQKQQKMHESCLKTHDRNASFNLSLALNMRVVVSFAVAHKFIGAKSLFSEIVSYRTSHSCNHSIFSLIQSVAMVVICTVQCAYTLHLLHMLKHIEHFPRLFQAGKR